MCIRIILVLENMRIKGVFTTMASGKKPIISVKMKVLADQTTRENINNAYELFNEQVKIFEEFFLLFQQRDYYFKDQYGEEKYVSEDTVKNKLRNYIADNTEATDIDAVMDALNGIREIIRSRGVQAAGSLSQLYDIESTAGTNNIAKIVEPEPEWVSYYDEKKDSFKADKYEKMANEWIASEEGQRAIKPILEGSGRPSAFKSAYNSNKRWYKQFVSDQKKYKKDSNEGLSAFILNLERLNALPIIKIDEELYKNHPVWVRCYIKSAIENYASYIESDETKRKDYIDIETRFYELKTDMVTNYAAELEQIEMFLKKNYVSDKIYLNSRMVRGADILYREWKKVDSEEARILILNEYQSDKKKQKKIGDVNLFSWLAKDENQNITEVVLDKLTKYYIAYYKYDSSKKCSAFTKADSIESQRYLSYYGEGGSNSPKYKLSSENSLWMHIPVLLKTNEIYFEKNISFKIAYSKQVQGILNESNCREKIPKIINKDEITFTNNKKIVTKNSLETKYEIFNGKIKGAEIRPELNMNGNVKDIFVSYTIEVDSKCSSDFINDSREAAYLFRSAYDGNINSHLAKIRTDNIRALAVDLGLKQFGACAVGKVKLNKEAVLQEDISYERRFMLKLPGEDSSSNIEKWRDREMLMINKIRREINFASFLKKLYNTSDFELKYQKINQALSFYKDKEKSEILQSTMNQGSIEEMNEALKGAYDYEITQLNMLMNDFRSSTNTTKQKRRYEPGKSYWAITYYEELRKVIMAWNSMSYQIEDDNRNVNKKYGVTATRLLTHINNLKDDRIKTGADMIVQSARGYIYDEDNNCWIEKFEPCNLIVFEDLSRYSFKSDRPKKENSKLMKWSHAAIIDEVTRQAEVYGIEVITIDASYSSKYHFITGAPGIRCDYISRKLLNEHGQLKSAIQENLPEELSDVIGKLSVNCLIPSEVGSIFVTEDKEGKLVMLNADLNAACNLLKRAFLQQTHINSINTENHDGELIIKKLSEDENVGRLKKGKYQLHFGTQNIVLEKCGNHFKIISDCKNHVNPKVGEDKVYSLHNDPSGVFFDKDEWVGYKEYWDTVRHEIISKLKNTY